jgi:uncharacterized protein
MAKNKGGADPIAAAYELLRDIDAEDGVESDANADLVLAAYFGDKKAATKALDRGASPDARQEGTGLHALWLAVSNDHVEIVKLLLSRGADASATVSTRDGRKTVSYTALDRAQAEGKHAIVKLLGAGGAKLSPAEADRALGSAVWDGDAAEVKRLCAAGANPNVKTATKEPVLAYAVRSNGTEVVAALLKAGADPNTKGVLQDALSCDRPELVVLLLDAGAKPDPKAVDSLYSSKNTRILEALLAHGLDPNAKIYGDPLLFVALRDLNEKWVELLLRHKADPNLRIKYGKASFEVLYPIDSPKKRKLLGLLLDHGLDPRNMKSCGNPLSTQLIFDEDVPLLKRLLEAGADPNLKSAGATLYYQTQFIKNKKTRAAMVALLEKHGAKKPR